MDGMHIRNLMITYFFRFFEQLVHESYIVTVPVEECVATTTSWLWQISLPAAPPGGQFGVRR